MKIKELREILVHFTDSKYDDYEVELFDYDFPAGKPTISIVG